MPDETPRNPLCFVLMPFGVKNDTLGRPTNFDSVYRQIIAPAIVKAGLDPVRADEERVGGAIHKPMFERLMMCPYAVADVTGANPNVYYELGIRHSQRPRSTIVLFSHGTLLPFDIALLRCVPYRVDDRGEPIDTEASIETVAQVLQEARNNPHSDSPFFQLIDEIPSKEVEHSKTDHFRERASYSEHFKTRLTEARKGGLAAVRQVATDPELKYLHDVEVGVIIDLFLSFRAVDAYDDMIALYQRMPEVLKRLKLIREQYGFALNRKGEHRQAEQVLQEVIDDFGQSSETNGLLGRVYKDLWQKNQGSLEARNYLKRAVASYSAGFQADWRDAFPGVNAVTLMEMMDKPPPEQAEILPVVRYAASQKAKRKADYWDHATLMELAVLARDADGAENHLADALGMVEEPWQLQTTERNLRLIRDLRQKRGENGAEWSKILEDELNRKYAAMKGTQVAS